MIEWLLALDTAALDAIQGMRCAFLDAVMPFISKLGDGGAIWIALTLVLMLFRKTRRTGYMLALSLVLGLLIGNLTLKPLIARVRPYDANPDFVLLIDRLSDYSFPSGHTLASFEAAAVLLMQYRAKAVPALVLALLIAFSRLYLYVHYPSDVFAGALLGVAFACIARAAVKRMTACSRIEL